MTTIPAELRELLEALLVGHLGIDYKAAKQELRALLAQAAPDAAIGYFVQPYADRPSVIERVDDSCAGDDDVFPLYRHPAPSQPSVPDALPMQPYQTVDQGSTNYNAGWSACRKAMLAKATRTTVGQVGPAEVAALVEALEHARMFIRNGVELGFIRMPDADTPDPAHDTLPKIDAALAAYRATQVKGGDV